MKIFNRILAAALGLCLVAGGAFAVSADDTADIAAPVTDEETAELEDYNVVALTIEGTDATLFSDVEAVLKTETVTVGDIIRMAMENNEDLEVVGVDDGYITSINGLEAGTFGGYDGWLYAVEYFTVEEGEVEDLYNVYKTIDVPMVGINDYVITDSCSIVLYYGDYDIPFAGYTVDEESGMIKLVGYSPVYDENYEIVDFAENALAGGTITLVPVTVDEEGNDVYGDEIVFTADENGITELDADGKAVANGIYLVIVEKDSDVTVEIGDVTLTKPAAVRSTDALSVDNPEEPSEEEIKREKISMLLLGC